MKLVIVTCLLGCGLTSGAVTEVNSDTVFVSEPQDAWVRPGESVQLDCELAVSSQGDICAWRLSGTHLGVDHFYNVSPPDKVHALFPEHERICSLLIEDADWRHAGFWTCWPLAETSHVSSRDARLIVAGDTTPAPTSSAATTTVRTTAETTTWAPPPSSEKTTRQPTTSTETTTWANTTTSADTTTERSPTTPEPVTPSSTEPSTPVVTTTEAPPTTTQAATSTVAPPTTDKPITTMSPSPSPEFVCPQPYGLFADPSDTRYFYYCQDGIAVHMQCEYPQLWDDTRKTCA